jgi:organic hydroperoxide reductase OsmC/OhrA
MNKSVSRFAIEVDRIGGYEFRVRFDKPDLGELHLDEPAPLGRDSGPNPARVLAAAVGTCLSASLLFCLSKAHIGVTGLSSEVEVELVRNEARRLRIGTVEVTLRPELDEAGSGLSGCLGEFEDFCVVTQSVREGLDVRVKVEPVEHGARLGIDRASDGRLPV